MKALFIGGTGTISSSISALCVSRGWDLTLLNRGNADARMPQGARAIHADIRDEAGIFRRSKRHIISKGVHQKTYG